MHILAIYIVDKFFVFSLIMLRIPRNFNLAVRTGIRQYGDCRLKKGIYSNEDYMFIVQPTPPGRACFTQNKRNVTVPSDDIQLKYAYDSTKSEGPHKYEYNESDNSRHSDVDWV